MNLCGQPTKQWGDNNGSPCLLEAGHRGHHSISVFTCDGCNKIRRGQPKVWDPDGDRGGPLGFCYVCTRQTFYID